MRSKKKGCNYIKNEAKKKRARANQKARRARQKAFSKIRECSSKVEKKNKMKTAKCAIRPLARIRCTRIMHGSISMKMSVHNLQATNDPQEGGQFTTTLDSGANCHTANTKNDLHACQPLKRGDFNVKCANGNVVSALGCGTKHTVMQTIDSKNKNSETILLEAEKVHHLPNFAEAPSTKRLMAENLLAYHCEPGGTGTLKSRLGHAIKLQETADMECLAGTALPPDRLAKTGQAFSTQQDSITLPDNLHHANANTKANRACVETNKLNEKEHEDSLKESNEETMTNDMLSQCDRQALPSKLRTHGEQPLHSVVTPMRRFSTPAPRKWAQKHQNNGSVHEKG